MLDARRYGLMFALLAALAACGSEAPKQGKPAATPLEDAPREGDAARAPDSATPAPKKAPRPTTLRIPDELARLVPKDSLVLVYIPSLNALGTKLRSFMRTVDPSAEPPDMTEPFTDLGVDPALVDHKRPIALAATLVGGGTKVVMIPVVDAERARAVIKPSRGDRLSIHGNYAVIGDLPGYKPGDSAPPIAEPMPHGDAVLRLDLGGLFALVAPMMEQMLAQAARDLPGNAKPGYDVGMGWVRTIIESSERLDVAVSFLEKGEIELRYTFVAVEGSGLQTRPVSADVPLATFAGWLEGESYPFQMLLRTDPKQNVEQLGPLFELVMKLASEEEAELVKKASALTKAIVAGMGPHVALGMRAASGDLEITAVLQPPDPKGLAEALGGYFDLLVEQGDLEKVLSEGVVMDGAEVHRFELVKPPPKFPEGGFIAYAVAGDKVVLALSTDWERLRTTLRTAKRGTGAPAKHVLRILSQGDPKASLLFYCDVRALLQGIDSFQPKPTLKIRAGEPVPFWILATTDGRSRTFAFRADAVGLAEIVEMLR